MKVRDLVKVRECETELAFGHILGITTNKEGKSYQIRHIDDGQILSYCLHDIEKYSYEDMLKEYIFIGEYNTHKTLQITKKGVTIDGIDLSPTEACKLASDILEFYAAK